MRYVLVFCLHLFIGFSLTAQDFNSEKGDLMLFVKRMYLSQPFEGVKVIDNGVIIVCVEMTIKSNNASSMSQVANIKAKSHLNKFLNGSFVSSDFVMTTQENVSQVDSLKAYQAKIMEVFKEQASGVVAGLELLSSFDVDSSKKVFIYLRNKL
jgi:hypothetical protein